MKDLGSTLSLPVSGTDLQAIHGVRFFSAAGVDYLAYLQVENGNACGDVAVWSDGTSAYIATVITGLGLRVYKIG